MYDYNRFKSVLFVGYITDTDNQMFVTTGLQMICLKLNKYE